jgi:hypothetical protein
MKRWSLTQGEGAFLDIIRKEWSWEDKAIASVPSERMHMDRGRKKNHGALQG